MADRSIDLRDPRTPRASGALLAFLLCSLQGAPAVLAAQEQAAVVPAPDAPPEPGSLVARLNELARSMSASQRMLKRVLAEGAQVESAAEADRQRSVAHAALYAVILLQLLVIVQLVRKLLAFRGQLASRAHEVDRLLRELQQASGERERTLELFTKEGDRRLRAEASERLASLSEQSVQRSIEEVLDSLDRRIAVVLDRVLEDVRAVRRKDLSTPERRRLLDRIAREGETASDVLGELVDLRRLHRGELTLDRQAVDPTALLARLSEWAEPIAEARERRFELSLDDSLPARIETDPRRLLRILKLIVSRALETAGASKVVLRVQFEVEDDTARMRFSSLRNDAAGARPIPDAGAVDLEALANEGDLAFSVASSIAEALGGALAAEPLEGGAIRYSLSIACGALGAIRASRLGTFAPSKEPLTQTNQRLASALLAGKRILIADDAQENLRVIEWVLGRAGAECTLVENGREAVERALAAQGRGAPYDLILLDLQMPLLDGYEALRSLREQGSTTPVIALTAASSMEDRQLCLERGFADFLSKPIDRNVLLRQLAARFCAASEAASAGTRMVASAPSPTPLAPLPLAASEVSGQSLTSLFANDESMDDLIEWFTQEIEKDVVRIERALERGDRAELAAILHQLKGSAGSYGFPAVSEQAERVESCITRNEDAERLQTEVAVLLDLCNRLAGN